jgi:hypothetical protein
VPVLPEEAPADLTERQLIERHSRDENCMGCHKRIDPFGFALEGFDAIGRARKADTKTTLPDGTQSMASPTSATTCSRSAAMISCASSAANSSATPSAAASSFPTSR